MVISQPAAFRMRAVLILFVVAATSSTAYAVPAFARKYQTSCQTCHSVFPKLNAHGEAFRLRGYRMPAEDEDMVKEPPVLAQIAGQARILLGR